MYVQWLNFAAEINYFRNSAPKLLNHLSHLAVRSHARYNNADNLNNVLSVTFQVNGFNCNNSILCSGKQTRTVGGVSYSVGIDFGKNIACSLFSKNNSLSNMTIYSSPSKSLPEHDENFD